METKMVAEAAIVEIGSTVEVEWEDGARATYSIDEESRLSQSVISADAPLARAIVGARSGETRTFSAGRNVRTARVLAITRDADVRA